ncbi:phage integrase SAM-like domain-containing protein [Dysgonomonas sp. GY75]|uniref:phage integrase SAM-like domain-containing protein n=1 Tax=Dysgonomonas sp. GY75 TaxID=2780419 RepID=UPI0018841337|nr:phage integrase SAM-like domain-containing protein [Dysgonomonas sp. GY75]
MYRRSLLYRKLFVYIFHQNTLCKVHDCSLLFNEISLEFIQRFHQFEVESGNKPSTIYKKHASFKFLLGLAIDKELIKKSPYDKFKIKKISQGENMDILTEEELQLL